MGLLNGRTVSPQLEEFSILINPDGSTFQEWTQLTEACRQAKVPTFSTSSTVCPNCHADVPTKWYIYVREIDKDILE